MDPPYDHAFYRLFSGELARHAWPRYPERQWWQCLGAADKRDTSRRMSTDDTPDPFSHQEVFVVRYDDDPDKLAIRGFSIRVLEPGLSKEERYREQRRFYPSRRKGAKFGA